MGDGCSGIGNAAEIVFPGITRLMCWSHVERKFRQTGDAWKKVPNKKDEKVRAWRELGELQLAPSPEAFHYASRALLEMWNQRGLGDVCGYLQSVWLGGLRNW